MVAQVDVEHLDSNRKATEESKAAFEGTVAGIEGGATKIQVLVDRLMELLMLILASIF